MTRRRAMKKLAAIAFGGALMFTGLNAQTTSQSTWPQTLSVVGRTNANVSVVASGSFVAAVWAASLPTGATDIYLGLSRDHGSTFSAPVRVNAKPGDAHVNGEQPPRVALHSRSSAPPEIVVVWTSKGNAGGTIVSARSTDGGKSFGATTVVAEGSGNRGWENITVDSSGNVHVVWLDHRELAKSASMTHMAEHHAEAADSKKDAVQTAQLSKLYTATLGEPGSSRAVTGGVCYCCKTAILAGSGGDIYLAWRHVYPQNIRDIAFSESHDGGRTFSAPVRVSEDKWQIEGCPEDGPGLALDARRQIHVVWPTLVHDSPNSPPSIGIFYALSGANHGFGPRQRVPTEGVPHHPQVALVRETLFLAWDELKNGVRQIVAAHRPLSAGANAPWSREVLSGNIPGTYPSLASSDTGAIVAWTSAAPNSVIRVAALKF
jgi:hypothetical protein